MITEGILLPPANPHGEMAPSNQLGMNAKRVWPLQYCSQRRARQRSLAHYLGHQNLQSTARYTTWPTEGLRISGAI